MSNSLEKLVAGTSDPDSLAPMNQRHYLFPAVCNKMPTNWLQASLSPVFFPSVQPFLHVCRMLDGRFGELRVVGGG